MAASEVMELVVQVSPEGTEETAEALENVEESFAETADGAEEKSGVLDRFARRWKGAMTVIVAALATASAALLSQVPIIGDLMDGLMAIVEAVALQMDQFLRPALDGVTNALFGWAEGIGEAEGPLGDFIGLIGTLVALLSGGIGLGLVLSHFGMLGTAIGLLSGPVGWAILAIGLLAAAWATNFGNIRGITERVVGEIQDLFGAHLPAWIELYERFTSRVTEWWEKWGDDIERVAEFLFDVLGTLFVQNLDFLLTTITAFLQFITGDWEGAWNTVEAYTERTLGRVSAFVDRWSGSFEAIWDDLVTGVKDLLNGFIAWLVGWGRRLTTAMKTAGEDAAAALLKPLTDALAEAQRIWDAISGGNIGGTIRGRVTGGGGGGGGGGGSGGTRGGTGTGPSNTGRTGGNSHTDTSGAGGGPGRTRTGTATAGDRAPGAKQGGAVSRVVNAVKNTTSRVVAGVSRAGSAVKQGVTSRLGRARSKLGFASGGRVAHGGLARVHAGEEIVPEAQVERTGDPGARNRFADRQNLTVRFEPRRFEEFVSAELEGGPANTGRSDGPQG